VIHKSEVMALGENARFVVTSLDLPSPDCVYRDLYCARGQNENYIKDMKNDLACDRTSDHAFLANHLRLYFSCAAYVLHHTLRTETLRHRELANAQSVPGQIAVAQNHRNPFSGSPARAWRSLTNTVRFLL